MNNPRITRESPAFGCAKPRKNLMKASKEYQRNCGKALCQTKQRLRGVGYRYGLPFHPERRPVYYPYRGSVLGLHSNYYCPQRK